MSLVQGMGALAEASIEVVSGVSSTPFNDQARVTRAMSIAVAATLARASRFFAGPSTPASPIPGTDALATMGGST